MRDPTDEDRATMKRIIEARTLAWSSSGKPDLEHAWCGSCGRPLSECAKVSGCPIADKVITLTAKHAVKRGDIIVIDSMSATSDRSDDESKVFPRNRKERREEAAKERSRRPRARRRW